MDRAGVLANSKLRRVKNILFVEDIQEILESNPPFEKLFPA